MTMRNTNNNRGIIAILLTVMFLSAAAIPAFAHPALNITISPDPPIQGQTLTVTVLLDGTPVPSADVYFVLNDGTPVHGQTNESGMVNYEPLLRGTMNITAMYMGMSTSESVSTPDEEPPEVRNPDANPGSIPADGTTTSQLSVTVTDNVEVASVTVDLSKLGGLAIQEMTNSLGTYTATTKAAVGTAPATYPLKVNATDRSGNYNNTVGILLEVTAPPAIPTPTTPPGVRGGGGAPREPEMNVPVDPETGAVLETTLLTVDGATLTFPKGTVVKDAGGNPLATSIFMLYAPTIAESVGAIAVYDFGPAGLTFEPPIDLVIPYDPADIPAGFDESDLVIRMWDGTAWIDFVTSIDTVAHVATAKVSHFTIFGLFATAPVAAPPVTPTPTIMPTATPEVTPTPTPSPIPRIRMAIVIVVVVAIVAAAIIVAVAFVPRMRRRKKS